MMREKKVQHLSIFLLKETCTNPTLALKTDDCEKYFEVPIAGFESGHLYIKKTPPAPPRWSNLFRENLNPKELSTSGVAAAFFLRVRDKSFVLTFGQGGRFLLREDVIEERFGLLCALNGIDPATFRCVDVQSLDAIDSHTRIQSGQETTSDQFGLSVEQDMLKAIVGTPADLALGSRIAGSDALSVSAKLDLADLPHLLNRYGELFEKDLDATNYQWVNNISTTKSKSLIRSLENVLEAKLSAGEFEGIWLSIPEIIEWTTVKGFTYSPNGKGVIHPDINMAGFLSTVHQPITLQMLRDHKVHCADADHNKVFKSWTVYKCLYAEIEHNGATHIRNDGRWFNVAGDFVTKTQKQYSQIPSSKLIFPEYTGCGEGAYNAHVAALNPSIYDLLDDKKKVMHGGGHGQVEICDLLSINRELIHIKIYGKSSVLSHLFAQGYVSGQLIQIDPEFRKKAQAKLAPTHSHLIAAESKPGHGTLTITYAVISDAPGTELHLPFFSKVNLVNTRKMLEGFGYKVELLKIPVSTEFAKKKMIRPARKR